MTKLSAEENTLCPTCNTYNNRGVTVDGVVTDGNKVLLVKRKKAPCKGMWGLPGGYVGLHETMEQAVLREIQEETGLQNLVIKQMVGQYSEPTRDPREAMTVSFWLEGNGNVTANDDAEETAWFEVEAIPEILAFDHKKVIDDALRAMAKTTEKKVVFAAMSKRNFFLREHVVKFVLKQGYTPTCAFMMYSYFLLDTVERKALISANNDLVRRSDELWVFGEISDGVQAEIDLAKKIKMPIKYYRVDQFPHAIEEVVALDLAFSEVQEAMAGSPVRE